MGAQWRISRQKQQKIGVQTKTAVEKKRVCFPVEKKTTDFCGKIAFMYINVVAILLPRAGLLSTVSLQNKREVFMWYLNYPMTLILTRNVNESVVDFYFQSLRGIW